jgi:hypothetical protein
MAILIILMLVSSFCLYSVLANLIVLFMVIKVWTEYTKAESVAARR